MLGNERKSNASLSRRVFFYLLGVTFISIFSLGFFWINSKLSDYHKEVNSIKKTYSVTKKLELNNKILRIKDYIRWVQNFPGNPISKTLENQIRQLKLPNLKERQSTSISQAIKDSICNSRIPVCVINNRGKIVYSYNPFSKNGKMEFAEIELSLVNRIIGGNSFDTKNLLLYKNAGINDSILKAVGCFNNSILPGFKVVSMVTDEYFEKILQIHILDSVSKLRYGKNEYVFINAINGKALLTNGKYNKIPVDIYLSGNPVWIDIFKVQQSSASHSEGVFHTYLWPKLSPSSLSLKTSYFSYIPDWKWIIGTGFYQDEINSIIETKRLELYAEMRIDILNIIFYLIISTLVCYILVWFYSKQLGKNITLFKTFFEKAAIEHQLIDKSQVSYREFAYMAEAANLMVEGRKLTEKALMDSESHYRYLFEQNPAPLLIYELGSLKILSVNEAFTNHYGYSKEEALEMQLSNLYPENEGAAIKELSTKLKGLAYAGEWHQIKKDGTQITIEAHSHGFSYDGRAARIAVINDISERKKSEEKIINLNRVYVVLSNVNHAIVHVREKQELFNKICQIAIDDGKFIMAWIGIVNPETNQVEVVASYGNGDGYLDKINIDLGNATLSQGPSGKAIKTGLHFFCNSIANDEIMIPWRDNALAHGYKSSISLPFKIYGNISGVFALYSGEENSFNTDEIELLDKLAMDISFAIEFIEIESNRKQIETELLVAKEKAEESDRLKTAFLHNVSHEIRTPLNAIVGFAGFLDSSDLLPEKRKYFIEVINESSDQLLSIITDIVNISTIEAGQEKIVQNEIELNAVLKQLHEQFLLKAKKQNIALHLKLFQTENEINIISDETKLTQILSNLVNNALKFTKQGFVNFGYEIKDGELEFFVEDSGIGIPFEMREEIFKRFRQVESTISREFGGSGLGLSISKAYVELLGGKIWVISEINKGSTFFFTIPYKKAQKTALTELSNNELKVESKQLKTILVAEDEDSNFELLEEILDLTDLNINIIRACNGKEAVEICRTNNQIDLVLMDIKMPVMDGYEATKQIRGFIPNLPIIAQTAYTTDADRNKAMDCGCSDFISKPFNIELLVQKIQEHLYLRKAKGSRE